MLCEGDALHDDTKDVGGNGCAIILLLLEHGASLDTNTVRGNEIWQFAYYKPGMQDAITQATAIRKAIVKR